MRNRERKLKGTSESCDNAYVVCQSLELHSICQEKKSKAMEPTLNSPNETMSFFFIH